MIRFKRWLYNGNVELAALIAVILIMIFVGGCASTTYGPASWWSGAGYSDIQLSDEPLVFEVNYDCTAYSNVRSV